MKKYWPVSLFALLVLIRFWGILTSELFVSPDHIANYPLTKHIISRLPSVTTHVSGIFAGIDILPIHYLSPVAWLEGAWGMALSVFIACIGMWFFLNKGSGGIFGGIAYGFTGLMVSLVFAGHGGKMWVMAVFPWLLWFFDNKQWVWLGIAGWFCLSQHIQMAYYAAIFTIIYWLTTDWRRWKGVLLAGLIAGMLYVPQFVMTNNIVKMSTRGARRTYERATSFSMPPEETMCVLDKSFKGEMGEYWGRKGLKQHTEFMGAICVLMAIVGIFLKRRMPVVLIGLASAIIAFGGYTPIYKLIYHIPPNGMFRSPSMAFFGVVFMLAYFAAQSGRRMKIFAVIAGLVLWADLWAGTSKYTVPITEQEVYGNVSDCAEWLQKDKTDFRIFAIDSEIADNRWLLWGISSINGYYPFPRKEFVDSVGGEILPDYSKVTTETIRQYNVKYIVSKRNLLLPAVFVGKNYRIYKI